MKNEDINKSVEDRTDAIMEAVKSAQALTKEDVRAIYQEAYENGFIAGKRCGEFLDDFAATKELSGIATALEKNKAESERNNTTLKEITQDVKDINSMLSALIARTRAVSKEKEGESSD